MSIRVHELAHELGVASKNVLAELDANGDAVRSASSVVPERAATAVRLRLGGYGRGRQRPIPRWPAPIEPGSDLTAVDGETGPLTAAEAGVVFGVSPATVRQWASRGYLTHVGHRGRAALYDRADLRAASYRRDHRVSRTTSLAMNPGARCDQSLVSVALAAQIAGVSPSTIRSWITRGRLTSAGRVSGAHQIAIGSLRAAVQGGALATDFGCDRH